MSVTRKHLIRRLARKTGIPALRLGLASRRMTTIEIAQRFYGIQPEACTS